MEILNKVKAWAGALAEVGISLAALMIVLEVLGLGSIPFLPTTSVIANVSGLIYHHRTCSIFKVTIF